MVFLFNRHYTEANFLKSKNVKTLNPLLELHSLKLRSYHLDRKIKVDLYLPTETDVYRSTLLLNDGQQMEQLELVKSLTVLLSKVEIPNIGIVAVHAYEKRIENKGIEGIPVTKNRGKKAERYANFIIQELTPFLQKNYGLMREDHQNAFAGFSGGALNALNISWDYPGLFKKVGIFSGKLANKSSFSGTVSNSPLKNIADHITEGEKREGLKFYFQIGRDQKSLMNENLDGLDTYDVLDLIRELEFLGYANQDITYKIAEGGPATFQTWSKTFPEFLKWAFPVKTRVKIPA